MKKTFFGLFLLFTLSIYSGFSIQGHSSLIWAQADFDNLDFEELPEEEAEEAFTKASADLWKGRAEKWKKMITDYGLITEGGRIFEQKAFEIRDTTEAKAKGAYSKQNWQLATEKYEVTSKAYEELINNFESFKKELLYIKARPAFESMQAAKDKDKRKYNIAFKYMLDAGYLKRHLDSKVSEIEFDWIAEGVEEKFPLPENPTASDLINSAAAIEYNKLANLFEDAQENPIQEVRMSIANGGILPGARGIPGNNNQDVGTRYVGEVFIPKFVNTLSFLALSISTIMLIIGGMKYIFSYGEEEAKAKAKDIILWSIVGIVIIAMSYTIVKFVITLNFEV